MIYRTPLCIAITLALLAIAPFSLTALAKTDDSKNRPPDIARSGEQFDGFGEPFSHEREEDSWEGEGWDDGEEDEDEYDEERFEDDEYEDDEYEDDEYEDDDEEDCESSHREPFLLARELATIAESQAATLAYVLQMSIETSDEEQAAGSLQQILGSTDNEVARRLITIRLVEMYVELEQPTKVRELLVELCR